MPAERERSSRAACSICCGKKGRVEWGIGLGLVDSKDKNRVGVLWRVVLVWLFSAGISRSGTRQKTLFGVSM